MGIMPGLEARREGNPERLGVADPALCLIRFVEECLPRDSVREVMGFVSPQNVRYKILRTSETET
jgi:hypothetical protein